MKLEVDDTKLNKKTLCVVTIAMICSNLALLSKFQYFRRPCITQSNIYDGAFIAKIVNVLNTPPLFEDCLNVLFL